VSNRTLSEIISGHPIVPVLTIDDAWHAVPLAVALQKGGIDIIEVTLRTDAAIRAIRRIRQELPDVLVGAGTILHPDDFARVMEAGAHFAVSPGTTPVLFDAAAKSRIPFLPGIATPSEAMRAMQAGYDILKFFPAVAAGGIPMLKSMAGPLPDLKFCPTGGVSPENLNDFLALDNVICVGGTWIAPTQMVRDADWATIEARARHAMELCERSQ